MWNSSWADHDFMTFNCTPILLTIPHCRTQPRPTHMQTTTYTSIYPPLPEHKKALQCENIFPGRFNLHHRPWDEVSSYPWWKINLGQAMSFPPPKFTYYAHILRFSVRVIFLLIKILTWKVPCLKPGLVIQNQNQHYDIWWRELW